MVNGNNKYNTSNRYMLDTDFLCLFQNYRMSVLNIDIPEEKTSTKTSNDEGDFISVTVCIALPRE